VTSGVVAARTHGYLEHMRDTTPEAASVVRSAIKRTDPVVRLREALAHSEAMRDLALARLRAKHPHSSTLELVELLTGTRLIRDDRPRP
jgi:hypothetical protein